MGIYLTAIDDCFGKVNLFRFVDHQVRHADQDRVTIYVAPPGCQNLGRLTIQVGVCKTTRLPFWDCTPRPTTLKGHLEAIHSVRRGIFPRAVVFGVHRNALAHGRSGIPTTLIGERNYLGFKHQMVESHF